MSIASEISRIQTAKADIADSITNKGVTVPSSAKIDDMADLIDAIQTGGGTDDTLLKIMNRTITSIDIPSGVISVPQHFFNGCTSLSTINFPTTIKTVGVQSFRACVITSVDLRNFEFFYLIDQQSFYDCKQLTEVYLPATVTTIGLQGFFGCSKLNKFVILRITPPTIGTNVFNGTRIYSGTGYIYVPYSSDHSVLNAYKTATNWSTYANQILELDENGNIPT